MANVAIIALGGTGQTVLDLFLRSHLLRVGPLEKSGLTPSIKAIVVDQETENKGDLRPPWEVLRDFLLSTSASRRFSFERYELEVGKGKIESLINSANDSKPLKPERAYASKPLLEIGLVGGSYATPAALGFAWPHYAQPLITNLYAALHGIDAAIVISSTFGGAGTGFTPAVLQLLRSRDIRFISVIALDQYLTTREARASADLMERYKQNHAEYERNLNAFDAGGQKLFARRVLTSPPEEIWDKDADRKFAPENNPIWQAAWWISRLIQEYEKPMQTAVGGIPADADGVEDLRLDLQSRSQKAKNAVRYLVEDNFMETLSRDPLAGLYIGKFLRAGVLVFWKKWLDRVEGEKFDRFVPKLSAAMSETFRDLDEALQAPGAVTIDFGALREALYAAELPEERDDLHPILEKRRPRADEVLEAAAAELLYRLMRRRADK
jgi:hypothetical protein